MRAHQTPPLRLLTWALFAAGAWLALAAACAGTPPCEKNSDCLEGFCLDGECKVECADSQLDCPKGYICNQLGRCEYHGGAGGSGGAGGATGGSSTSSGGGASSTGSGTGASTSSTSSSGGVGTELDLCGGDQDCAGALVCKQLVKGGKKRCTRACTANSQCMSGTRCEDDGSGSFCLGDDIGRACTDPSLCNFGCLTGPGYCTAACAAGADCPNGYGCMAVGSPPQQVCVNAAALCDVNNTADCIGPAACDMSPNLILSSCTLACNTAADCPQRAQPLAPWSCDGLCRRPPDVYGPLPGGWQPTEWYCDGNQLPVVLCNDAQHIDFVGFTIPAAPNVNCQASVTTTGAANDACVDSCRYRGGCPHGFACVALGSIASQRVGLCLPVGLTEPGQSCANNTACVFGYCSNGSCSRDCTADGVCPGGLSCVAGGGPAVEGMPFRRCE